MSAGGRPTETKAPDDPLPVVHIAVQVAPGPNAPGDQCGSRCRRGFD